MVGAWGPGEADHSGKAVSGAPNAFAFFGGEKVDGLHLQANGVVS